MTLQEIYDATIALNTQFVNVPVVVTVEPGQYSGVIDFGLTISSDGRITFVLNAPDDDDYEEEEEDDNSTYALTDKGMELVERLNKEVNKLLEEEEAA